MRQKLLSVRKFPFGVVTPIGTMAYIIFLKVSAKWFALQC